MNPTKVRWGILSTGKIAHSFVQGLRFLPEAEITAVGSRTAEAAARFADVYGIPRRHGSYAALAEDPEVDVVYIATPHNLHAENTILCLQAGKAVLCEKPFAVNAAQAEQMITAARAKNLFLMEALWTRFLPAAIELKRLVAEGAVGEPRMLEASFGFTAPYDPDGRLFNPELGGGALLDLGIYPLSLACFLFGSPNRISGLADLGKTGVDERAGVVLGFPRGQIAVLHFSLVADLPSDLTVMGTTGRIRAHAPIFRPDRLTVTKPILPRAGAGRTVPPSRRMIDSSAASRLKNVLPLPMKEWLKKRVSSEMSRTIRLPYAGNGYNYEAAEVMRALREGRIESLRMPLNESLAIMRTMDEIRALWGLKYPGEA